MRAKRSLIASQHRQFGWKPKHDERSRNYRACTCINPTLLPRTIKWDCPVTLDQRETNACSGYSMAQRGATMPDPVPGIDNATAQMIYELAKKFDQYPGEDYKGSSVLGAARAVKQLGWWEAYRWTFSIEELRLAVSWIGAAVLGIPWRSGMSEVPADGIIKTLGKVMGGHAIECNGYDAENDLFRLHNSWGPTWGINGECRIRGDDLWELLEDHGEACVPVPKGQQNVVTSVKFTPR